MTARRRPQRPSADWLVKAVWLFQDWKEASLLAVLAWAMRHWRGLGVVIVPLFPGSASGSSGVGALMLACLAYLSWAFRGQKRSRGWWTHATLAPALVTSGVLRQPPAGEPPPRLTYRGKPQHSPHGTTVTVALPGGRHLADVASHRQSLAACLRVPSARLEVSQHPDDPANVVRLHVSHGKRTETPATVAAAHGTVWRDPVRIGVDSRGEAVHFESWVALMLRNGQDAALVLGHTPALALPEARGEALYSNGGAVKAVQLDRLTDQAWQAVCKRATELRRPHTPAAIGAGSGARFPETPTPVTTTPPVDPVLATRSSGSSQTPTPAASPQPSSTTGFPSGHGLHAPRHVTWESP